MSGLYAVQGSGFFASLFGSAKPPTNEITPTAQKICAYLARKLDADGGTTCIYWATGPGGSQIQLIGDLTAVPQPIARHDAEGITCCSVYSNGGGTGIG